MSSFFQNSKFSYLNKKYIFELQKNNRFVLLKAKQNSQGEIVESVGI